MSKSLLDVILNESLSIIEKESRNKRIKRKDIHKALGRRIRFNKDTSKMIIKELEKAGNIQSFNHDIRLIKKQRRNLR